MPQLTDKEEAEMKQAFAIMEEVIQTLINHEGFLSEVVKLQNARHMIRVASGVLTA